MLIRKFLIIIIISFIGIKIGYPQPAQYWIRYYSGGELDYTRNLAKDNNGNYIVTGASVVSYPGFSNYGIRTIKYDSLGNLKWMKVKDDPNSIEDDPFQILLDDSNNIYIFGIMAGKFFLIKYDEIGNEKWYQEFDSQVNYYQLTDRACIDEDSNVYCAGANVVNGHLQSFIRKYSSEGNLLWHKNYDSLSIIADYPASVIFDKYEHLFLTGCSIATDTTNYHYIIKINKEGNISWKSFLGTDTVRTFKEQSKLIISNIGELYLLGSTTSIYPNYGNDIEIIKLDSSGNQIWKNYIRGDNNYNDIAGDIIVDDSNNVYVTGSIEKEHPPNFFSNFFVISKFNHSGELVWQRVLGESEGLPGKGNHLGLDKFNNLYVAGGISGFPPQAYPLTMIVLKYNEEGDSIWSVRKDLFDLDDNPAKMVINEVNDFTIILTGGLSYVTIRYSDNTVDVAYEISANRFELQQNYPNPFNPTTTISYSIIEASKVKLELYDVLGNKIKILVDEYKNAGNYSMNFDGSLLSSGIYFYRLITENFIQSKKMLLLK